MSNIYIAKTPAAEAAFFVGEFEHEFSVTQERDLVASGLIEIVPRRYRVLTDTPVHGVTALDKDPTFEAALLIEQEAALVAGGHIERVVTPPAKRQKKES